MDPLVSSLERKDPTFEDKPNTSKSIPEKYNRRFELDYYNPFPIRVEISEQSNDLYADAKIFDAVITARREYGQMSNYQKVRLLANPFEGITTPFLNRAATKMASIRYAFPSIVPKQPLIRIGMLAEAPGAMLEYLMWFSQLQGSESEVTAISLVGGTGLKWMIDQSRMAGVNAESMTILTGKDGTGDLTVPDNIISYIQETLKRGERDIVVADGGVGADDEPEKEEELNGALILGEVLCALQVLRLGGSFVLKIYDAFGKFMADVLQLLARHFRICTIFKPLTSRRANAERYVICRGFTGLHIIGKAMQDMYSVLTLAANKGPKVACAPTQKSKIDGFLPKAPSIIIDWIVRLNNWHAESQISFLKWAIIVDKAITKDSRARPNYPISYDISRWYSLVGVPFSRGRHFVETPSTPCEEIALSEKVSQLANAISRIDIEGSGQLHTTLFRWLRYYSCIMSAYTASAHMEWNPDQLDNWANREGSDKTSRLQLKAALATKINYEIFKCPPLTYIVVSDGDKRMIRGETQDKICTYYSIQVSRDVLSFFLTPKERARKDAAALYEYSIRSHILERTFVYLKRYEVLGLTDNAYRVTYTVNIDIDLYATILTRSASLFYSPVAGIEASFGAIDVPLGEKSVPERSVMALNLLYVTDEILRDALINRVLLILSLDGIRTLYVATQQSLPILDKSKLRMEQPIVLAKENIVNTITGRPLDKRVLLYKLASKEAHGEKKIIGDDEALAAFDEAPDIPSIKKPSKPVKAASKPDAKEGPDVELTVIESHPSTLAVPGPSWFVRSRLRFPGYGDDRLEMLQIEVPVYAVREGTSDIEPIAVHQPVKYGGSLYTYLSNQLANSFNEKPIALNKKNLKPSISYENGSRDAIYDHPPPEPNVIYMRIHEDLNPVQRKLVAMEILDRISKVQPNKIKREDGHEWIVYYDPNTIEKSHKIAKSTPKTVLVPTAEPKKAVAKGKTKAATLKALKNLTLE